MVTAVGFEAAEVLLERLDIGTLPEAGVFERRIEIVRKAHANRNEKRVVISVGSPPVEISVEGLLREMIEQLAVAVLGDPLDAVCVVTTSGSVAVVVIDAISSCSGFLPSCDERPPAEGRLMRWVSIPFWVSTVLRQGVEFA